jgi:DDE_Tnp_1-associated
MITQPIAQPIAQCPPLIEVLAEVSDFRHARGKRHPLPAILALVCVATLCGYRSYSAIAQWARVYPRELVVALGLTHPTSPCAATLSTILRQLDRAQLEAKLGAWAESALLMLPPAPTEDEAVAVDGKALRGSQHQGALNVHLLSALSHRLGLTLGQSA